MSTFDEGQHPREGRSGRFTEKTPTAPVGSLATPQDGAPAGTASRTNPLLRSLRDDARMLRKPPVDVARNWLRAPAMTRWGGIESGVSQSTHAFGVRVLERLVRLADAPTAPRPAGAAAYPTVPLGEEITATVTEDGEDQVCACGNSSATEDWMAADASGRIDPEAAGSSDEREHTICPVCGLIYRNADLFAIGDSGGTVAAIARADTTSEAFVTDRRAYDAAVYGGSLR